MSASAKSSQICETNMLTMVLQHHVAKTSGPDIFIFLRFTDFWPKKSGVYKFKNILKIISKQFCLYFLKTLSGGGGKQGKKNVYSYLPSIIDTGQL